MTLQVELFQPECLTLIRERNKHLLKECKLAPTENGAKCAGANKTANETYTMFKAGLKNLLNYYVSSQNLDKDFYRSIGCCWRIS